nr:hypothetical protein [uncultured Rhodopila sp.]
MSIEIITTVLVAAAAAASPAAGAYDLTDMATVLDELQIPPNDTKSRGFLQRGITQVSDAIARHCNRVFQVETLRDNCYPERDAYPYQVPGGVWPLQLMRWPILPALVTLATAGDTRSGATLPFTNTAGLMVGMPVHAPSSVPGGAPTPGFPHDATVASIIANESVTLSFPITQDVPEGTTVKFGPRVVVTDPPGTYTDLILGTDYTIDADAGWLIRLNKWTGYPAKWDPVLTVVRYQAGYNPIPAGIVDAALRVITTRNDARGRDPYLRSRDQPGGLGSETYWIGGLPGVRGMFTEEVADLLNPYRVPVVR